MAKLFVASFSSMNEGLPLGNPSKTLLDFASGAVQTDVLSTNALRFVRLCADAPCFYEVGASPVVVDSSRYLPANTVELIQVESNSRIRVAAAAE